MNNTYTAHARRSSTLLALALLAALVPAIGAVATAPPAQAMGTTITVTSTLDLADTFNHDNHTCTWTSGAIFFPDASEPTCTLRRAVLEAANRPDSDRPITIEFDIPTTDPNYDSGLGIWEVQIDETYEWDLDRQFITDQGGSITIDGDTQTGGRTTGPKIMINTNRDNLATFGRSLTANTDDNVLTNLGFHGGGQLIFSGDDNKFIDIWMGLSNDGTSLELASDVSSQAKRSMAAGGIFLRNTAEGNTIMGARIIGASQRAITVDGDDNLIKDNFIGLDANGTLGLDLNCTRDSDYVDGEWYGGDGILVIGSRNTFEGNTLAGLHRTGTATESPARAFEIDGTDNVVQSNTIGAEADGTKVGVCGGGIQLAGDGTSVTGNSLYGTRIGSDNPLTSLWNSAIVTQSFSGSNSSTTAHLTVHTNVIDDIGLTTSTDRAYELPGNPIQTAVKTFPPAKVTEFFGTSVSGTNGDTTITGVSGSCPGCTVFLYVDDLDDNIETHELLATTTADGTGDWSATLSRSLTPDEGLRTQSMANATGVIGTHGAGMTSRVGEPLVRPTAGYVALNPARLLDTRSGSQVGQYASPWGEGETRSLRVTGKAGVPRGAEAVALHITTVSPTASFSWLTVSPSGAIPGTTAVHNFGTADFTSELSNDLIIAKVGTAGNIDIENELGSVELVIDVVGYYSLEEGDGYTPLPPGRIIDSRPSEQVGPFSTPWGPGETRAVDVTGVGGVPGSGATAVALNITTVSPTSPISWLTISPTGSVAGTTAVHNFGTLAITTELVNDVIVAKIGTGGTIDIKNASGTVDLVIDVVGYYSTSSTTGYQPINPVRVLDSRNDTVGDYDTPWSQGLSRAIDFEAVGICRDASAVVAHVTTVSPSAPLSWLTVSPSGTAAGSTAAHNFGTAGYTTQIVNDVVIAKTGTLGNIDVFNQFGTVDLVIDLVGYYGVCDLSS